MHDFNLQRHSRSSRITLSVNSKGKIKVTAPKYVSKSVIAEFVHAKQSWIEGVLEKVKTVQKTQFVGPQYSFHANRARAKKVISKRVNYFAELHGFTFKRISIKNTSSRWGSCSTKGNLNFNYKLLFLSESLRDYIVIHELCHLRHHNHSSKFWKEVSSILPLYRVCERELKKYPL